MDDFFREEVDQSQKNWRKVVAKAAEIGIPAPTLGSALSFFDGYRRDRLPANLLQAQRDYFGAHTYQRVDGDDSWHHTDWTGDGMDVSSGTYNA